MQVLARFEGFPMKKLEALRMAAALYLKLDAIVVNLQNWKPVVPLGQLLDKAEKYFNKVTLRIIASEKFFVRLSLRPLSSITNQKQQHGIDQRRDRHTGTN